MKSHADPPRKRYDLGVGEIGSICHSLVLKSAGHRFAFECETVWRVWVDTEKSTRGSLMEAPYR